jgi:topoisomerase IA-like protein
VHRLFHLVLTDDHVGETWCPGNAERSIQHGSTQIGVDEQRALSLLRERDREIRNGRRFAVRRARTRQRQRAERTLAGFVSRLQSSADSMPAVLSAMIWCEIPC